jgi:hypothetical protein
MRPAEQDDQAVSRPRCKQPKTTAAPLATVISFTLELGFSVLPAHAATTFTILNGASGYCSSNLLTDSPDKQ